MLEAAVVESVATTLKLYVPGDRFEAAVTAPVDELMEKDELLVPETEYVKLPSVSLAVRVTIPVPLDE